jgi:hypothetical protein
MKNLLSLGKILSKNEQKEIDGGWRDPNCGHAAFCDCSSVPNACSHVCVNC